MITVNIKGGLGNQMFQYAFGRALSLARGEELKLDLSGLRRARVHGDAERPFALGEFNLACGIATAAELRACRYPYGIFSRIIEITTRALRKLRITSESAEAQSTTRCYFDGYWQSPRYFEHIRDVLLEDFTLKQQLGAAAQNFATQMQNKVSVSIHIRRGDYVKDPRVLKEFGICSLSYYQKAIAHIERVHPDSTYFVFSDDIGWTKENLDISENVIFVSHPDISDAEELLLMSMCAHNIIANSSFSWWAAWLNRNPDQIVVAPTPWFNTVAYDPGLIPETWTLIPKQ